VCCITPSGLFLEETKSTLQFASRIKSVKTNSKINILDDDSAMDRLQDELSDTKKDLQEMKLKLERIEEENLELKGLMKMLQADRDMALKKVESYANKESPHHALSSPKSPASRELLSIGKDEVDFDIEFKPSGIDPPDDEELLDYGPPPVKGMPVVIDFDDRSVLISEATPPSRYGSHRSLQV
jgi:hypothetical protein